MFSLIITIVAIALVVAITAMTMYHGGDAIKDSGQHIAAAQILNEGTQLRGALVVYQASTGEQASSVPDLVASKYLTTALPGWDIIDGYAYHTVDTHDVCLSANQKVGVNTVPACSDVAYGGSAVCCSQGS